MIDTSVEYAQARDELLSLESRLRRIEADNPPGAKGFTKAGIRKLIARLHEELAIYEGTAEAKERPVELG